MVEYRAENGKVIKLNVDSKDKCIESCKNAPELDDDKGGKMQAVSNAIAGGERAMEASCVRFCYREFEWTCFPAYSTVVVRDRGTIQMSDLRIGDHILVMRQSSSMRSGDEASDFGLCFEPVISWLHRDPDAKMKIVQVHHRLGEIHLSSEHMIFIKSDTGTGCFEARLARNVSIGDRVLSPWIDGSLVESEVTSISEGVALGAFAPLTPSGMLLVDGTAASCYAAPHDIVNSPSYSALLKGLRGLNGKESVHEIAHMLMLPVRLAYYTTTQWQKEAAGDGKPVDDVNRQKGGIDHREKSVEDCVHPYGLFLYDFCKIFAS
jgi:hypothetical protein